MNEPRSTDRLWPYLAACAVLLIVIAAVRWSLDHPFGIHSDESLYLNKVHIDVNCLHERMFRTLVGRLLRDDAGRPPAYRLLALPFLSLLGFHVTAARMISLVCYGFTCWFLYKATRRIGSPPAAAVAVMIFALSPDVVAAAMFYGTEGPLHLATSGMLYYLLTYWNDPLARPGNWIGLGLALGVGFLSKASFLPIAIPVLAFWLLVRYVKKLGLPSPWPLWKAGVLAGLVALPWWALNLKKAIAITQVAREFVRDSLGPPSLLTGIRWLATVCEYLLGHGTSIFCFVVAALYLQRMMATKTPTFAPREKAALWGCACVGGPIVVAQLSGTNHLLRHISPALMPFGIVVAMLVDRVREPQRRLIETLAGCVFGVQLLMLVSPVVIPNKDVVDLGYGTNNNGALPWRTLVRFDQWDWKPLRDIADHCNVDSPTIGFLGNGREFSVSAIQAPWMERRPWNVTALMSIPNVKRLWRYENGPIDWENVMGLAGQHDIVVTAPQYIGEARNMEDLDNAHNAEFFMRLSKDARFEGPLRLEMGRFAGVEIDVFVKESLGCAARQPTPLPR